MRCACAVHVHVHVRVHMLCCACLVDLHVLYMCEHVLCMCCASTLVQPHIPRNRGINKCQSTMWTTKTRATELFSAALTMKTASIHAYLPILGDWRYIFSALANTLTIGVSC